MAVYSLKSGSTTLVAVVASSNLDGAARKNLRRGVVLPTLGGGTVVQYLETSATGDILIEWTIPRADGNQRGVLQSAANGAFGDELTLVSPKYGDLQVAVVPSRDGYEEEWLPPDFGYNITMRFVRL